MVVLGFCTVPAAVRVCGAMMSVGAGAIGWHVARAVSARGAQSAAAVAAHRSARRTALAAAGLTYAGVLSLAGLLMPLGPAAASCLVVLAALLTAATAWVRRRHRPLGLSAPDAEQRAPAEDGARSSSTSRMLPAATGALSTPQLCLAWRHSYLELQRAASDPAKAGEVVLVRQCFLDELERRDRPGFERWLNTGARAASDPSRYLVHGN